MRFDQLKNEDAALVSALNAARQYHLFDMYLVTIEKIVKNKEDAPEEEGTKNFIFSNWFKFYILEEINYFVKLWISETGSNIQSINIVDQNPKNIYPHEAFTEIWNSHEEDTG